METTDDEFDAYVRKRLCLAFGVSEEIVLMSDAEFHAWLTAAFQEGGITDDDNQV